MSPQLASVPAAAQLRARWQALAPRERRLLRAAAAAIALALLWWVGIAPALQLQRTAPARHAELDAQLQRMQALQAEAQQLQGAPHPDPDNARRALQSAVTENLGASARLSLSGDQATVTLKGTPGDALAPWLAQVRSNAHAVPQEVHLVRSGAAPAESRPVALSDQPAAAPAPRWDGTLVLALPPR